MVRVALRSLLLIPVLLGLGAFGDGAARLFAPSADPWPRWQAHDPDDTRTIDHGAWDAFLGRYLVVRQDGVNRLRYAAVSEADRRALEDYIAGLEALAIDGYSRPVQMAYWINLYNAATVRVVLAHYPVASIRDIDISPGLFADGPWGKAVVEVDGVALSLNDIEHRILRPIWRDPRIHYAVNCASIGCPDLAVDAYRGADIDARLERAARAHINDPRGVSIDGDRVTVSAIYNWFIEDFGGDEAGVLAHLKRHAAPELRDRLAKIGALHDTAYDWALNDAGEETTR